MKFYKLPLDQKVGISQIAIENTRRNPPIKEHAAAYNFDENRLLEGEQIIMRINQLTLQWNAAKSEKMLATEELYKVVDEAKTVYSKTRRIAWLLFKGQEHRQRALAMDVPIHTLLPQWLEQARQFYTNALIDEEALEKFSFYGITVQRLNEEKTLLAKVEKAMANQEKKIAQNMEITQERKLAVKELDKWMSKFFTILRLAMGKSQWLEAVGIVVKN